MKSLLTLLFAALMSFSAVAVEDDFDPFSPIPGHPDVTPAQSSQPTPPPAPVEVPKAVDFEMIPNGYRLLISDTVRPEIHPSRATMGAHHLRAESKLINHNGVDYIVFVVKDANGGTSNIGETFLVRKSDGLSFRWINETAPLEGLQIEDGILTLYSRLRRIDLDRFDIEARFETRYYERNSTIENRDPYYDVINDGLLADRRIGQPRPDVERSILQSLLMADIGSAAVLGEGGVGKTYQVRATIKKILEGRTVIPRTWQFFEVTPARLMAGASLVGQTEERVEKIIYESQVAPTILVMDEFHSFRGAGTSQNDSNDVLEMFKPQMADGRLRAIVMDNPDFYHSTFSGDTALYSRIRQVTLQQPTDREELRQILRVWLQANNRPVPENDVLDAVIDVSNQLNAEGAQPRKALTLLDILYVNMDLAGQIGQAARLENVMSTAHETYNIDPSWLNSQFVEQRIAALEAGLNREFAGMDAIKRSLVDLTRISFSGMGDPNRPRLRALLTGPRGTGKTQIAFSFARLLGLEVYRVDMTQYGPAARGDSRGPDELQREIASQLRKNAMTVFVIDEIEKASLPAQNALLAMFDRGEFTTLERVGGDSGNRRSVRVSTRQAFFISTSNAASEYIERATSHSEPIGFGSAAPQERSAALNQSQLLQAMAQDGISEPYLDRQQAVHAVDYPWTKEFFGRVVTLLYGRMINEIATTQGIRITMQDSEGYLARLIDQSYQPRVTGRDAERLIDGVRHMLSTVIRSEYRGQQVNVSISGNTPRIESRTPIITAGAQHRCAGSFQPPNH